MDVYGYTEYNILFKITNGDADAYYELSAGMEGGVVLMYRTSLEPDGMNDSDIIICD